MHLYGLTFKKPFVARGAVFDQPLTATNCNFENSFNLDFAGFKNTSLSFNKCKYLADVRFESLTTDNQNISFQWTSFDTTISAHGASTAVIFEDCTVSGNVDLSQTKSSLIAFRRSTLKGTLSLTAIETETLELSETMILNISTLGPVSADVVDLTGIHFSRRVELSVDSNKLLLIEPHSKPAAG